MNITEKLAALRAKAAADKLAKESGNASNASTSSSVVGNGSTAGVAVNSVASAPKTETVQLPLIPAPEIELFSPAAKLCTEIDHMEFLSKMTALQESIHHRHPNLPTLLFQIHTQLKKDPECVTLLSEDGIGQIVKGLEVQTKTALVQVVAKQSKARDKKTTLTTDMI